MSTKYIVQSFWAPQKTCSAHKCQAAENKNIDKAVKCWSASCSTFEKACKVIAGRRFWTMFDKQLATMAFYSLHLRVTIVAVCLITHWQVEHEPALTGEMRQNFKSLDSDPRLEITLGAWLKWYHSIPGIGFHLVLNCNCMRTTHRFRDMTTGWTTKDGRTAGGPKPDTNAWP